MRGFESPLLSVVMLPPFLNDLQTTELAWLAVEEPVTI